MRPIGEYQLHVGDTWLTACWFAEIHDKFEDLEWMQRTRLAEGMLANDPSHPYALEVGPKVKARNRYVNVQAWANCRIHLRVPEGECDFINASPITLMDSVTQEARKYIATQVGGRSIKMTPR